MTFEHLGNWKSAFLANAGVPLGICCTLSQKVCWWSPQSAKGTLQILRGEMRNVKGAWPVIALPWVQDFPRNEKARLLRAGYLIPFIQLHEHFLQESTFLQVRARLWNIRLGRGMCHLDLGSSARFPVIAKSLQAGPLQILHTYLLKTMLRLTPLKLNCIGSFLCDWIPASLKYLNLVPLLSLQSRDLFLGPATDSDGPWEGIRTFITLPCIYEWLEMGTGCKMMEIPVLLRKSLYLPNLRLYWPFQSFP